MRTRPLGQSGIEASVVGLGTWVTGGFMWGGSDEADSIRAIHAALDAGITLVDTAPIYGFGRSETVVGKALADRRDKVVLATKCGIVCHDKAGEFLVRVDVMGRNERGLVPISKYLGPESIRQEVEDSLFRLQTDTIDLYQTHWQEETTAIAESMGELLKLKQEGKIRAIGVSNATAAHMKEYLDVGPIDSDQEKYSMLARDIEKDQLPFCEANGIAMLAYSPLGQGLLTGKVGPDRVFPEGDLRKNNPAFSVEARERVEILLEAMAPIAETHDAMPGQIAIAWALEQPGMTHALCGARTEEQARENATAGRIVLNTDELQSLDGALVRYEEATKNAVEA
jgi:aryl-alcohol dehydrogenase-like predicted oxidoreductase